MRQLSMGSNDGGRWGLTSGGHGSVCCSLKHFKEWDVGDPLYYRTDRPYCAFNKAGPVEFPPDPAIGARLPGSQCVDPEPAAGTAVDVVRMLRGAHSDSDLKLAIRKIREIRAAEGGQR